MSEIIIALKNLLLANTLPSIILMIFIVVIEFMPIKKNPSFMILLWSISLIRLFSNFNFDRLNYLKVGIPEITYEEIIVFSDSSNHTNFFSIFSVDQFYIIMVITLFTLFVIKELVFKIKLNSIFDGFNGLIQNIDSDRAFCYGLFRPVIFLPKSLNDREKEIIYNHELAHIKYYDNHLILIYYIILIFNFFNPMIYLAGYFIRLNMERRADNYSFMKTGINAKKYADFLLRESIKAQNYRFSCVNSMFLFSNSLIKKRIISLIRDKGGKMNSFLKITLSLSMLFLFAFVNLNAKQEAVSKTEVKQEVVSENVESNVLDFFVVEKTPKMIESLSAFYSKLNYPEKARKEGVSGDVILSAIIDEEGNITELKVHREKPTGYGFGEESMAAYKDFKFTPGEHNGKKVKVKIKQPVKFQVK
ncbi:MAG: TonB family protein [Candidatus Delongbacteria bacterium]|nr:TonB family protein [Candidatus Delongbacteria bacterium]MBN2833487.1 TonB family protein [Candidatus Delongbacteria bacterium]